MCCPDIVGYRGPNAVTSTPGDGESGLVESSRGYGSSGYAVHAMVESNPGEGSHIWCK